jgi:hypothetical protein
MQEVGGQKVDDNRLRNLVKAYGPFSTLKRKARK